MLWRRDRHRRQQGRPGLSARLLPGTDANWLVCLAVWFCWSARARPARCWASSSHLAVHHLGFEHSVATCITSRRIAGRRQRTFAKASGLSAEALASLTWGNFAVHNLHPRHPGNIAGGALFVGMIHWWTHRGADGQTGPLGGNRPDERPWRCRTGCPRISPFPAEDNIKADIPSRTDVRLFFALAESF